jgi:type I restriction enzyme, S subunit
MKNWPMIPLRDVLTGVRNGIYKHEDHYGRGTRILKMFNIARLEGNWDLSRVDLVELTPKERELYLLNEGDILLNRVNSPEWVGKCAMVTSDLAGSVFESKNMRLRLDLQKANPKLISLWLNSALGRRHFNAKLKQIAGMATLNREDIDSVLVPLPPLKVQHRIAAELDSQLSAIDEARVAAERRVVAAEALEAALLREHFHGITPVHIGPPKQAAPAGWKWTRLLELADLESGHTPSRKHPEWWDGDIPWIALPDIRALDGKVAMETKAYTNPMGIANSSARILPKDTVVFGRDVQVGFTTIMGRPMATSQHFFNWICGKELAPWFLLHALRASREHFLANASGAIHKTLYMPAVKDFHLCHPARKAQETLAAALSTRLADAATLLTAARAELAAIQALPAAALRRVFS